MNDIQVLSSIYPYWVDLFYFLELTPEQVRDMDADQVRMLDIILQLLK